MLLSTQEPHPLIPQRGLEQCVLQQTVQSEAFITTILSLSSVCNKTLQHKAQHCIYFEGILYKTNFFMNANV